jgi:hypothetical protein
MQTTVRAPAASADPAAVETFAAGRGGSETLLAGRGASLLTCAAGEHVRRRSMRAGGVRNLIRVRVRPTLFKGVI